MARLSLPRCRRFGGRSGSRVFAAPADTHITGPWPEQPINRTRTNKMTQIQGYFDPRFETVRELFAQQQSDPQARGAALCVTVGDRSEEHTSELQSRPHLVCRLLLEKKKKKMKSNASK